VVPYFFLRLLFRVNSNLLGFEIKKLHDLFTNVGYGYVKTKPDLISVEDE